MQAKIYITLKEGVLDPQGKAIEKALGQLGFGGINGVQQGKLIEIDLEAASEDAARQHLTDMCEKLLANVVIEDYRIDIDTDAVE